MNIMSSSSCAELENKMRYSKDVKFITRVLYFRALILNIIIVGLQVTLVVRCVLCVGFVL